MDIVAYYTEISKREILENKEIKEFNEKLESELLRVSNLKFGSSVVSKLLHPIRTLKNNSEYKYLKTVRNEFDSYVASDVLMYVDEEHGDLVSDLESAARYFKPRLIREYVKTVKFNDNKKY